MNKTRITIFGFFILFLSLIAFTVSSGNSVNAVLNRALFGSSAGNTIAGDVSINGTMGQAIVGSSAATTTQLTSGYWWSPFTVSESDNLLFLPLASNNHCGGFGGPVEDEDNDNPTQANGPLCFSLAYQGGIYHDNENEPDENTEDWFFINWNGAGTLHIQVNSFPTRAQVRLYHESNLNSSVAGVTDQPDGNYSFDYDGGAGSGRYYIRLFVPGEVRPTSAPDYELTVFTK